MPNKSIDSIGPKPNKNNIKPVAEHKAGEVVRPKGAPTQAGESIKPKGYQTPKKLESTVGKLNQPKRPVNKKKVAVFAGFVGLFALVGAGLLAIKALEDNKPAEGEYAVIEGRSIKRSEFEALRDAYIRYDEQKGQNDERISERRAADELMTRVGLEVRAEKYGIGVTQDDIDSYLAPAYLQYGSRDGLLRYNQHLYGWDEKPLYHKAKLDLLKQKLQSKIIAEMDLLGVYIRWDNHMDKSEEFQKEYGRKAVERLEKDYLPRLNGGQVAGDFIKTTDVNASLPVELNNERLNKTDDPIVRYLELKSAVNDPKNDPFQHGQKASDAKSAWAEIEKLEKVGDTTPVFKSDSGMYLALRIERKSEGEYISYESYLKKAIQEGKVDSSYNELPIPDNGRNILPTPTSSADVSLLAKFLPKATASGSRDCWAQDPLQYEMRPADGSAGYASITNNPFTVLVVRSGSDTCIPYNGFGYFMNAQGRQAWTSPNVQHGMVIPLNCYGVVWDFAWSAPSGYQGFTAGDYQAPNRILTGFGSGLVWAPSDISGLWRNANIYYGIANGAGRYAVAPIFYPDAPPPPPQPHVTFMGYKVDENNNPSGTFSSAQVYIDGSSLFTKDLTPDCTNPNPGAQPYCINNITADANHVIRPQAVPGYEIVGYREGSNGLTPSAQYNYVANSQPNGATIHLWWVYRPIVTQTSSVSCTSVAGTITGSDGINIASEVLIGGESLGPTQGKSFNFAVPNHFRDGVSRAVTLRVTYTNGSLDYNLGNQVCPRSAQCIGTNLSSIFPGGRAALNIGEGQGGIKVSMNNDGQAIWSGFSRADSGKYQLGLTPESSAYWSMPVTNVPSDILSSQQLEFTTSVTLMQQPNDNSTSLNFTMIFVPNDGSAPVTFGSTCGTTLRVLSSYGPWLRTQNGNVSAMGVIKGQEALTSSGGSLGGRRSTGASNDDLNHESTYLTMSQNRNVSGVVGSGGGNGPFCSTNTYLLGRDNNTGLVDNTSACTFSTYAFRLYASITEGLRKGTTEEVIYNEAESAYNAASCSGTPALNGPGRYARGATNYDGSGNLPGLIGGCPTITALQSTAGVMRLGPNPTSPVGLLNVSSRGTIIVDGNLYINANIRNNATGAVTFNVDDLNGLNNVPNLGIIVRGNIIIDRDVTQIDASLYASGQIQTCDLYNPDITGSNNAGTTTGYKPEQAGGPTGPNSTAQACNKQLTIHGLAASKGGFKFGRNYVDFASIATRMPLPSQYSQNFDYHTDRSVYYGKPAEDIVFNGLMLLAPPPAFEYLSNPDFASARYTTDSADPRL